ncbi:IS110 family transposase [Streptomyces sp. ID05-26A]|nr:IS110 family transposase [Streptomyces sp. ID05-26A]
MTARPGPLWVGIDVGKRFHHAVAVDAEGTVVWSHRVPNEQTAITELIGRTTDTASDVRWAIDLTSAAAALLLALLLATEQPVIYVPARVVNRMSDAFAGEGKTDAKDAHVIAQTARMRRDLTRLAVPEELIVELNLLTGQREDLTADWVRGVNRLRGLLTGVFPALEAALDYTTSTALTFVLEYCTPAAIQRASDTELTAHLATHHVRADRAASVVRKARAAADAQTIALPGQALSEDLIRQMASALLNLRRQLNALDKLITARFRAHPQAQIIESMPGMGPVLGAEFLAITAGDLRAFATPAKLATYAGLAPIPHDSGNRSGVLHRPKRYHRRLRHIFYMAAFSSTRTEGPSRAFYERKRSEHQRHTRAMVALARRLVDVLWALLRDNRLWEPIASITPRAAA